MATTRNRRPNRMRYSEAVFLGKKTTLTELLDPEVEGRVENAHTGLSPREADELRCKARGETFLPIEEAERRRKARPAKKHARKMDLGAQLLRLAQAAAKDDLDDKGVKNLDESEDLDITDDTRAEDLADDDEDERP